jgi:hypothetical protein
MVMNPLKLVKKDVSLPRYEDMCRAVAECHKVDDVKDIRDKAEALRAYCRQAENRRLEVQFAEIKVRAERKAGELLVEMRENGELAKQGDNRHTKTSDNLRSTLADLDLTYNESSEYQQIAQVSNEVFEAILETAQEQQKPVTSAQVRKAAPRKVAPKDANGNVICLPDGRPANKGKQETLLLHGEIDVFYRDYVQREIDPVPLCAEMLNYMRNDLVRQIPFIIEYLQKVLKCLSPT